MFSVSRHCWPTSHNVPHIEYTSLIVFGRQSNIVLKFHAHAPTCWYLYLRVFLSCCRYLLCASLLISLSTLVLYVCVCLQTFAVLVSTMQYLCAFMCLCISPGHVCFYVFIAFANICSVSLDYAVIWAHSRCLCISYVWLWVFILITHTQSVRVSVSHTSSYRFSLFCELHVCVTA